MAKKASVVARAAVPNVAPLNLTDGNLLVRGATLPVMTAKVNVIRFQFFGAKGQLAAAGITRADAEKYIAAQQESNSGFSYAIEPA